MKLRAALLPLFVLLISCAASTPPPAAPSGGPPPAPAEAAQHAAVADAPSEANAAVPVRAHNATWGSRTALVTIVEYSDFQCPYCQRTVATVARIRETYGPETV